jgi:hypothetical protein
MEAADRIMRLANSPLSAVACLTAWSTNLFSFSSSAALNRPGRFGLEMPPTLLDEAIE